MSDTRSSLNRQIVSAGDLQSVVRTMKAVAASSIGQYEQAVGALGDYNRVVELGLGACLRRDGAALPGLEQRGGPAVAGVGAVVFGSDQGLVGQFNDVVAEFAIAQLAAWPGQARVWAVGERVHARLVDAGLAPLGLFAVPGAVSAIAPLVGRIQLESDRHRAAGEFSQLHLFHNEPRAGGQYAPRGQRLLPLDSAWATARARRPWPTTIHPEVLGGAASALRGLIREYLFISLFRACAESLASENASRLAAMQRADQNIDELLVSLRDRYHRLRQSGIDEELFDVIAGYEAIEPDRR